MNWLAVEMERSAYYDAKIDFKAALSHQREGFVPQKEACECLEP